MALGFLSLAFTVAMLGVNAIVSERLARFAHAALTRVSGTHVSGFHASFDLQ